VTADLLRLDGTHAIRVVFADPGHRAGPVTRVGDDWVPAVAGDGAGLAVLHRLRNRSAVEDGFRVTAFGWVAVDDESERAMGVDQTHDSWVVGGRVVVKWMTESLVGPHPVADRLRRLASAGFPESPQLLGLVEWREPATGHWIPVAVVQAYLPGTEDGWTWAVDDARRALGVEPGEAGVVGSDFAGDLGALTGRMHLALADDPPSVLTAALARAHADEALGALDLAVRVTEEHDPESHALLSRHRPRIAAVLSGLAGAAGAAVLPVHGDLHVGQILRDRNGGYAVIDFDGNPTRSPTLRAADAPGALDVAGMMICLENVAQVARQGATGPHAALDWAAMAWTSHAQARFLSGYREALGDRHGLYDESLVPAYSWEQLCREFVYAVQHDFLEWLYVPAAALRRRVAEEPA
jgi:maltokinase